MRFLYIKEYTFKEYPAQILMQNVMDDSSN